MIITYLLWTIAGIGLLLAGAIVWARALMRQMRREQEMYEKRTNAPLPGPAPRIVSAQKVQQRRAEFEKQGFRFLGYIYNPTKHELGRPNVDLAFASSDGTVTAAISCMVWPRTFLYLNLPFVSLTGKWIILSNLESALENNHWISTIAMDMEEPRSDKNHFEIQYVGESASAEELQRFHSERLEKHDPSQTLKIQTLEEFLENQDRIHEFLVKESKREFESLMAEANESWPVDIDLEQ